MKQKLHAAKNKGILFVALLLMAFFSCKKEEGTTPVDSDQSQENEDTTKIAEPEKINKVLVISIDGATGSEIAKIAPEHITQLQQHSKYTYHVALGQVSTDAGSWADMLTGVNYGLHQIADSSFIPDGYSLFPQIFGYISNAKRKLKSAFVTPWSQLASYVKDGVDYNRNVSDDEAVKDTTVALLGRKSNLGLIFADFNSVEMTGIHHSFSAKDATYKTAVTTVDGYIGDIMTALKNRKNYKSENWLVIVTGNHGGNATHPAPGFMLCYNPNFTSEKLEQHGFQTIRFHGKDIFAVVPDDKGLYNFGSNQDYTIQMQIKFNSTSQWPGFFSKTKGMYKNDMTGWLFMQGGEQVQYDFGQSGVNGKLELKSQTPISDGNWHTLTLSVKSENGKRTAKGYIDGDVKVQHEITGLNLNSTAPLKLGYIHVNDEGAADFYAAGIEIFDVTLDAQTIKNNMDRKNSAIKNHPEYDHLIGFWPLDDARGSMIKNEVPGGYDMVLKGNYQWTDLSDDAPPNRVIDPSSTPSILPIIQDVPANILYWLGIEISDNWGWSGRPWLKKLKE